MLKSKKNGFTLIELIATLVIMAIIALIVTPLVMNIIRSARISADKRSVDAYGRSIELAIAGYLMDNGSFPTSIDQLTIEYSGDEVVCTTTQLNTDSSVYLADCTVAGRNVEGYTYGKKSQIDLYSHHIGDVITVADEKYYVISNSLITDDYVVAIKAIPLTANEIIASGGITSSTGNDVGMIAYYTSESCKYISGPGLVENGCQNSYDLSNVKMVVDSWAESTFINSELKKIGDYSARLIDYNDLKNNLGYEQDSEVATIYRPNSLTTPEWVYNNDYSYWTMTPFEDTSYYVLYVNGTSVLNDIVVYSEAVRPVINVYKSKISL